MVIDAGRTYRIPVSMCGEMAGDTRYTRLLLGMGLSDFSVHPTALLEVKDAITRCEVARYKPLVTDILDSDDPVKIGALLKTLNQM